MVHHLLDGHRLERPLFPTSNRGPSILSQQSPNPASLQNVMSNTNTAKAPVYFTVKKRCVVLVPVVPPFSFFRPRRLSSSWWSFGRLHQPCQQRPKKRASSSAGAAAASATDAASLGPAASARRGRASAAFVGLFNTAPKKGASVGAVAAGATASGLSASARRYTASAAASALPNTARE